MNHLYKDHYGHKYLINESSIPKEYYKFMVNTLYGTNRGNYIPPIKNVIFNDPATIVFWADNTKTVVKADDEEFDPEKGLAMAISKKALGNKGNYFNEIKKWVEKYEEPEKISLNSKLNDVTTAFRKFGEAITKKCQE